MEVPENLQKLNISGIIEQFLSGNLERIPSLYRTRDEIAKKDVASRVLCTPHGSDDTYRVLQSFHRDRHDNAVKYC